MGTLRTHLTLVLLAGLHRSLIWKPPPHFGTVPLTSYWSFHVLHALGSLLTNVPVDKRVPVRDFLNPHPRRGLPLLSVASRVG